MASIGADEQMAPTSSIMEVSSLVCSWRNGPRMGRVGREWRYVESPFDLLEARAFLNKRALTNVDHAAQIYYVFPFGIANNDTLIGLVNSAPYLCSAISCW